jgi:hypothetical protein
LTPLATAIFTGVFSTEKAVSAQLPMIMAAVPAMSTRVRLDFMIDLLYSVPGQTRTAEELDATPVAKFQRKPEHLVLHPQSRGISVVLTTPSDTTVDTSVSDFHRGTPGMDERLYKAVE